MSKSGKKNVAAIVCSAIPITSYAGVDNIIILADPKMNSTIKIISAIILILKITAISLFFFFFEKIRKLTTIVTNNSFKCRNIAHVTKFFDKEGKPILCYHGSDTQVRYPGRTIDTPDSTHCFCSTEFSQEHVRKDDYGKYKENCKLYESLYNDKNYQKWFKSKYVGKNISLNKTSCLNFYLQQGERQKLIDYNSGMMACVITQGVLYVSSIIFAAVINRK